MARSEEQKQAVQERRAFRKQIHAERSQRRRANKKDNKEQQRILKLVEAMLKGGGEAAQTPHGIVIVPKGIDGHIVKRRGSTIVTVAPAGAIDEAITRTKFPHAPPETPIDNIDDLRAGLRDNGLLDDLPDGMEDSIVEGVYSELGCAACNAMGVSGAEIADDLGAIFPLITAAKKLAGAIRKEWNGGKDGGSNDQPAPEAPSEGTDGVEGFDGFSGSEISASWGD